MVYKFFRLLLFRMNPEFVHRWTVKLGRIFSRSVLACGVVKQMYGAEWNSLGVKAFGLDFNNPIGLAAGFDKQGELSGIISSIGFGHMEVGSISLMPWPGNPSPTLLRLPDDRGLINRLGLNSDGARVVEMRLQKKCTHIPIGINLVKTPDPNIFGEKAIEDYLESVSRFYSFGDYITLNLSCPNTVDGKCFEDIELLNPFLSHLRQLRSTLETATGYKAFLVKLSPDLDDSNLERLVDISLQYGIDGFVIGNTTSRRTGLKTAQDKLDKFGPGGLSGYPLKKYIEQMIDKVFTQTSGQVPIVACGGVGCDPNQDPAREVWEYLKRGATLVQMYTGLVYQGPSLVRRINKGLVSILHAEGISNLNDFLNAR